MPENPIITRILPELDRKRYVELTDLEFKLHMLRYLEPGDTVSLCTDADNHEPRFWGSSPRIIAGKGITLLVGNRLSQGELFILDDGRACPLEGTNVHQIVRIGGEVRLHWRKKPKLPEDFMMRVVGPLQSFIFVRSHEAVREYIKNKGLQAVPPIRWYTKEPGRAG